MARPKIFDNVWASSGDTGTPPNAAKKILGWVKERVPFERWNWLQNRVENKINDVIQEGPGTWYPQAADVNKMIATGLWDESWGITSDTTNIISGGATKRYRDIATYINSDNNSRLLIADKTDCKIEIWDPRANPPALIITTNALDDDLDTSGTQAWEPISMCTDGTNVYVILTDTDASPDEHQIQAWVIDETSADWSVVSGWPSNGTSLPGSGNQPALNQKDGNIILASSTKLAVNCGWNTITGSGSSSISIISISDGSIDASGAGDAPTGDSVESLNLASDGTNIFFGAKGSTSGYICSATIADPTTGCGGTNYPLSLSATSNPHRIISCGSGLIVSASDDTAGTATDEIIRTHNSGDADLDIIVRGQDSQATPLLGDKYICDEPLDLAFDGLNLWILVIIDNCLGANQKALIKIDVARFSLVDIDQKRQISDISSGIFIIAPDTNELTSDYDRCKFDGRDIWSLLEPSPSLTNSGKIFRLPMASLRS